MSLTTPAAGTQGRGGVAAVPAPAPGVAAAPVPGTAQTATTGGLTRGGTAAAIAAAPSSAQSSSGGSVGTAIVISLVAVIVGAAAWALVNRRRPSESSLRAFCAQHPEDPVCSAA